MDKEFGNKITLGIFGGSFDPPHVGHIKLCREFSRAISAKVLVMPAKVSPFKTGRKFSVSDEDRLEMCRLAFSDIDNVEISDYELKCTDISYTHRTVEHFLNINPHEKICLCVGADCLETLDCWANAEYLFENCVFAAAYRYEDAERSFGEAMERLKIKYNADIIPLLYSPIEVSSTDVKELLQKNESTLGLLTENVSSYIQKHGLYGGK